MIHQNPLCIIIISIAWRDSVMTMEVTLDDDGARCNCTLRLDIIFDNDLIDWDHDDTEVLKGSHLS